MSALMGMTAEQVGPANLERLASMHIARYKRMLMYARAGAENIRIPEVQHLVACWEGVQLKKFRWDDLAQEERSEVYDAVYSEE